MKYGELPADLGLVDVDNKESMFYLYLPVKLEGQRRLTLPARLQKFYPILDAVREDLGKDFVDKNIYITAKAMWVVGNCTGQRPGWHCDGFMSDDLNYIWYDSVATQFYLGWKLSLPQDHEKSIEKMETECRSYCTYPNKTLLKMDETVIHRAQDDVPACFRTFIKVSVSRHIYAREGNSINYLPDIYQQTKDWVYVERGQNRNCPITN